MARVSDARSVTATLVGANVLLLVLVTPYLVGTTPPEQINSRKGDHDTGAAGMTEEAAFWTAAWRRFLQAPRVRNAFTDAAFDHWTPDRRYLTIMVDLSSAVTLATVAAEIAAAVESPAFGLVGLDGLHLTIQEIGFADTIDRKDHAVIERAIGHVATVTPRFQAAVTGVGSFADAAFFQVEPWEPFREMRRHLWAACPLLRDHGPSADVPAREGGFAAHVSIAYYTDAAPTSDLAQRLARFRGLTLPPIDVSALSLVAVRPPTHRYFQWDVLQHVPLGPVLTL